MSSPLHNSWQVTSGFFSPVDCFGLCRYHDLGSLAETRSSLSFSESVLIWNAHLVFCLYSDFLKNWGLIPYIQKVGFFAKKPANKLQVFFTRFLIIFLLHFICFILPRQKRPSNLLTLNKALFTNSFRCCYASIWIYVHYSPNIYYTIENAHHQAWQVYVFILN